MICVGVSETRLECLRSCGVIHAVIIIANALLMRVVFLPAVSAFATDYATERKVLIDLPVVRMQLSQTMMLVFCDQGVLITVAGILS